MAIFDSSFFPNGILDDVGADPALMPPEEDSTFKDLVAHEHHEAHDLRTASESVPQEQILCDTLGPARPSLGQGLLIEGGTRTIPGPG